MKNAFIASSLNYVQEELSWRLLHRICLTLCYVLYNLLCICLYKIDVTIKKYNEG